MLRFMTESQIEKCRKRLERFLVDPLEPLGRSERRHWGSVYVRGLLLDGERKSIEPLAARLPEGAEWPEGEKEPTKYLLCDLPAAYSLRRLVCLAKNRWKIEQDYQQLKEELGLDHYEGRTWLGWHHHVTLVMLAHAFLTLEGLRSKNNFWVDPAADAT